MVDKHERYLSFKKNGAVIGDAMVPATFDHPEPKSSHLLGASEMHGNYVHHYRGFIKRISILGNEGDDNALWQANSGLCGDTCDACPEDGACYGTCNWNHWYDEQHSKCQRCPLWCKRGCNEDGTC